jgi:lipid A 3-O-deacylase
MAEHPLLRKASHKENYRLEKKNIGRPDTILKIHPYLKINLIIAVIFLFCALAYGAENNTDTAAPERFFTEMGVIAAYGTAGELPDGQYRTVLLSGHLGVDLKRYFQGLKTHRGSLSVFLEPQIVVATDPERDYEFGVGVGIQYRYPLADKLSFYLLGSVGPHFITVNTTQQKRGFIFSDVAGTGVYYHITKDSAINVGYRIRHLSNADLGKPNGGINTHFAVIGYSVFFK